MVTPGRAGCAVLARHGGALEVATSFATTTRATAAEFGPRRADVARMAEVQEAPSGLPGWLDDMLKPGVSAGVFTTLKLALVGLVITLCFMLSVLTDATIRMHLSIFLGMSIILLVLIIWFVGELAKAKAAEGAAAEGTGGRKKRTKKE